MNLDELRGVQRAERQKDSLQHLRDSFYTDVAEYIAQLKDERERAVEAADDPFSSDDVRRLTDKIESTTEIANAVYERRVGKVVKHASFAAADMATDEEGMTTEERELFEDLVARIRDNRKTVLRTLETGRVDDGATTDSADPDSTDTTDSTATADSAPIDTAGDIPDRTATPATETTGTNDARDAGSEADGLLADALGDTDTDVDRSPATGEQPTDEVDERPTEATGGDASENGRPDAEAVTVSATATDAAETADMADRADPEPQSGDTDAPQSATDTERTTLRITADVGTVYGVDEREYDLAREDVIDLPTTNAEPLLRKNAAERID
jgi:DNA replication factor GINS